MKKIPTPEIKSLQKSAYWMLHNENHTENTKDLATITVVKSDHFEQVNAFHGLWKHH